MACVNRNVSHCFRVTESTEIDVYSQKTAWVRGFVNTSLESLISLLYVGVSLPGVCAYVENKICPCGRGSYFDFK